SRSSSAIQSRRSRVVAIDADSTRVRSGGEAHHQPAYRDQPTLDRIRRKQELLERHRAQERVVAEDDERVLLPTVEPDPGTAELALDLAPVGEDEQSAPVDRDTKLFQQRMRQYGVGRPRVDERLDRYEALAARSSDLDPDAERAH